MFISKKLYAHRFTEISQKSISQLGNLESFNDVTNLLYLNISLLES